MKKVIFFHDFLLIICYGVIFFILSLMIRIIFFSGVYFFNLRNLRLEVFWTLIPAIILIILVEPSLILLYISESFFFKGGQIIKVIGHQWYWSYRRDLVGREIEYDSYLKKEKILGDFRLLEVDLPIVVERGIPIFFFVRSTDVIHSFALPSLGIKIDAFPGRLNIGVRNSLPVGCYWGQCSEICGANHAFMPISLERIIFFGNIRY